MGTGCCSRSFAFSLSSQSQLGKYSLLLNTLKIMNPAFNILFFYFLALVSYADARDMCLASIEYESIAAELAELGPNPDRDQFEATAGKITRQPDPVCFRFLIKSYIKKMNARYNPADVQRYLESENPMFVSPAGCQSSSIEDYVKFGAELGKLGPNPPLGEFSAVQAKYDYLYDKSAPCKKVVFIAYRKSYKDAGFYETADGRMYINKMDPIGWIMEDSSEQE